MTLFNLLTDKDGGIGIPVVYSHFKGDDVPQTPPYIAYIGSGQDTFDADNTHYHRQNRYQLEYYFTQKNEQTEADIEDWLLSNGFLYEKSEDVYIESEGVFVIYYQI